MAQAVRYRGTVNVISGGYGRTAGGCPCSTYGVPPYQYSAPTKGQATPDRVEYITWSLPDEPILVQDATTKQVVNSRYVYSDSDYSLNSRSTQVTVDVRDEFYVRGTDTGDIIVECDTYVTHIEVTKDINPSGYAGGSYRVIRLFSSVPSNGRYDAARWEATHNVNWTGTALGSEVYIGHRTHYIPPQTWSGDTGIVYYNFVKNSNGTVMWNGVDSYSVYLDNMRFGLSFFNPNPNVLNPPAFKSVSQERNICDDVVNAEICFNDSPYSGVEVQLQWRQEAQDWDENRRQITARVYAGQPHCHILHDLPPRNTKIYWRAKYRPLESAMKESNWAEGSFETLWFPHPAQSVPIITEQDCIELDRGGEIDEITSPDQVYGWEKGEEL